LTPYLQADRAYGHIAKGGVEPPLFGQYRKSHRIPYSPFLPQLGNT
jgi:hypothetical protein